jgi:hypothetical protein
MKEYPWTSTFGPTKYGTPSGKLMVRAVSDREPDKINKENWFFMTGTLWRNTHLHTDRCAEQCTDCKCGDGGHKKC